MSTSAPSERSFVRAAGRALALTTAIVVALTGMMVSAPQAADALEGRSISGVVSLPDGAPAEWLRAVQVTASPIPFGMPQTVSTDPATGAYSLTGLAPGAYRLQFAPGYYGDGTTGARPNLVAEYYDDTTDYSSAVPVDVTAGDATGIDADLALGRTISGTVTIPENVDPSWIGAVSVSAMGGGIMGGGGSAVDPDTGDYEINGLAAGTYTVQFNVMNMPGGTTPNLVSEYYDDSPTLAGAAQVDVTAGDKSDIDASLAEGRSISGTVTLPPDAPTAWLRAVHVSAIAANGSYMGTGTQIDPVTGDYTIQRLAAGEYRVGFNANGYFDGGTFVDTNLAQEYFDDASSLAAATPVSTSDGDAAGIDAELGYGATLEASIDISALRAAPGAAEGFGVYILNEAGEMVTAWGDPFHDDDVPLNVGTLTAGTYRVAVETSKWDAANNRSIPVSAQFLRFGESTTITLEAGDEIAGLQLTALATDATVSGSIRAQGFAPQDDNGTLGSALFYERDGEGWVRLPARFDATENGKRPFELKVPAGTYTVGFEDEYSTAGVTVQEEWWQAKASLAEATPIAAVAGQSQTGIDGVVRSTGPGSDLRSISGVVSIPAGSPSEWRGAIQVAVNPVSMSGTWKSASVDPVSGAYSLTDLAPGEYRLAFTPVPFWDGTTSVRPNLVEEYYDDATDYMSADPVDVTDGSVVGINATLAEGRKISGTVTLPVGADPDWIRNVSVSALSTNGLPMAGGAVDPETGAYEISGLAPGAYQVKFNVDSGIIGPNPVTPNLAPEFWDDATSASTATPVDVSASNATGIDAELSAGRSISGRVSLPDDVPAEWMKAVRVSALAPDGSSLGFGVSVDPDTGEYTIPGLPAVELKVGFSAWGYFDGVDYVSTLLASEYYDDAPSLELATPVSTIDADATGIDADLQEGGFITGSIDIGALRGSGEGFAVSLTNSNGTESRIIFGDGFYEDDVVPLNIGAVAPGAYRLAVTTQDWDDQTNMPVPLSTQFLRQGSASLFTVPAGEETELNLTARKPDASIAGKIRAEGLDDSEGGVLGSALIYERLDGDWVRLPESRFDATANGSTPFSLQLAAGTYTVGYESEFSTSGVSTTEQWWKSKASLASATGIELRAGAAVDGINGLVHPEGWVPTPDPEPTPASFADVPTGHPFHREIGWLASEGISLGWTTPAGTKEYRPGVPINRDQMAAFLYRFAGSPAYTPPAISPFVDVPNGHTFYREISWLASEGISLGWATPAGTREYRPAAPINRDQMAAFLYRITAPDEVSPSTGSGFTDVPVSHQFFREIDWLASNGISLGWSTPAGREYRPAAPINRDQMAAFLYRLDGLS